MHRIGLDSRICEQCGMTALEIFERQQYRCFGRAPLWWGRPITIGFRFSFRIPTLAELFSRSDLNHT